MQRHPDFVYLLEQVRAIVNCESASLFLLDEPGGKLVLAAAVGLPERLIGKDSYRCGQGLTGWVYSTGKPLRTDSPDKLHLHPGWSGKWDASQYGLRRFRSLIAVPLIGADGTALGVLKIENKKTEDHKFTDPDQELVESVARALSVTLQLQDKTARLGKFIYAFVLMPFDPSFDDIYAYGIKRPIEALGIRCERGDEIKYVGGILEQVFKCIEKARFIVADMTGRNPNVFYEVGYCHAMKKDVILCAQSADDLAFDLLGYRHIIYEGKIKLLEQAIREWVLSLIDQGDEDAATTL
jgi:hypothetical protein